MAVILFCLLAMWACGCQGSGNFSRVGIGVYVLNVGEVDIAGGSCYLDYLLTIKQYRRQFETFEEAKTVDIADAKNAICKDTTGADWMEWNGTKEDIAVVNMKRTGEVRQLMYSGAFRVLGDHYFRTKLEDWPFETQTLELIIEFNQELQTHDFDVVFCHIYEYSGLSSSIRFPGERTLLLTTSHSVVERCWPPFSAPGARCTGSPSITKDCACPTPPVVYHNLTNHFSCRCQGGKKLSSRYIGNIDFNRPERSAFIKVYLAPMFILLVIMLTYWLPPPKDETRFSMCAATLLSAIFFHVNLHNQLPPTSTLTEADTLMINLYIVNLCAWVVTVIIMLCRYAEHIDQKLTMRIYLFTRILGPTISIPSFVISYFSNAGAWWIWALTVVLALFFSVALLRVQECVHTKLVERSERKKRRQLSGYTADSVPLRRRQRTYDSIETPILVSEAHVQHDSTESEGL